jgi:hypothetical protein|tara:strand:- start:286 stop:504 length:219 start_codon:yes stop_codon:yes gene_type:complete
MTTLNTYRKFDLISDEDLNAVQFRFDSFGVEEYQSWYDMTTDDEILDTVVSHQKEYGKIDLYSGTYPKVERK